MVVGLDRCRTRREIRRRDDEEGRDECRRESCPTTPDARRRAVSSPSKREARRKTGCGPLSPGRGQCAPHRRAGGTAAGLRPACRALRAPGARRRPRPARSPAANRRPCQTPWFVRFRGKRLALHFRLFWLETSRAIKLGCAVEGTSPSPVQVHSAPCHFATRWSSLRALRAASAARRRRRSAVKAPGRSSSAATTPR